MLVVPHLRAAQAEVLANFCLVHQRSCCPRTWLEIRASSQVVVVGGGGFSSSAVTPALLGGAGGNAAPGAVYISYDFLDIESH